MSIMSEIKCQVCSQNLAKYTCPKCKYKTCSLPCVKQHKSKLNCDGVRDKTAHVPIKEFSDSHLLSDYRFLEDGARKKSSISRDYLRLKKENPYLVNRLLKAAKNRGTDLKVLCYPMSRRKTNTTKYMYKDDEILWKVNVVFPQACVKYTEKEVNENTTIDDMLKNYLSQTESDPVKRQKLKQYVFSDLAYKVFFAVEGQRANEQRYHEMNREATLKENLTGKSVLENPVFHVVQQPHWYKYPSLSKEEEEELKTQLSSSISLPVKDKRHTKRLQFMRRNRRKERNN